MFSRTAQIYQISPLFHFPRNIGGPTSSRNSSFIGGLKSVIYRLGGQKNITVEVNNIFVNKEVRNVLGVIKGSVDPGSDVCRSSLNVSSPIIVCPLFVYVCACRPCSRTGSSERRLGKRLHQGDGRHRRSHAPGSGRSGDGGQRWPRSLKV